MQRADHRAGGLLVLLRRVLRRGPPGRRRFSVTVNMDVKVAAAIAAIGQTAWTAIRYPRAIWDDQLGCWVSDAQVAEADYTAFTSAKKGQQITARLIVRRVRDLNKQLRRAGRAVPRLALPRGIHRLPVRAGPGRRPAPRPRDRGAGLRRLDRRPAGTPAISGRLRSPVSFAQRMRSSQRARRRCRSSRSASWPFLASVAKAVNRCPSRSVNRCPSRSVNRSCAPGCGRSLRTMTRIPPGQDARSSRPAMSAIQAPSLTCPFPS